MENGARIHAVDRPGSYKRIHEDDIGEFEGRADGIMRDAVMLAGQALKAYGRAVSIKGGQTVCDEFTEQDEANVRDICSRLLSVLDEARKIGDHSHTLRTSER